MELTTVADDQAVVHEDLTVRTYDGLEPDTVYEYDGFVFRTLARPPGELLSRFGTVNDVHFGEVECGIIEGMEMGPTFSVEEGAEPYPEIMNRGWILSSETFRPIEVLTLVALVYFVLTWPLVLLAAALERQSTLAFRTD